MKIRIAKPTGKIIGSLRVSNEVYDKLKGIADHEGCSLQEVVRAILDEIIDEVITDVPSTV